MKPWETHPLAKVRPEMPPDQFAALVASVRADWRRELAIVTIFEDKVLDGRAILRACGEVGLAPTFRHFKGSQADAWRYSASLNLHRQHTRAETRVATVLRAADRFPDVRRLLDELKDAAKARQAKGSASGEAKGKFAAQLAGLVGVSRATAERVLALQRTDPVGFEAVASGTLTVGQAVRAATRANQCNFDFKGRYRVWYADPPWPYSPGTAPNHDPTAHYPVVSLDTLAAIPVQEHSADDAALFLWATPHFLAAAIHLAEQWGFTYRTGLVWEKRPRHGAGIVTGGWSKIRHEHLLICTRGAISPDVKTYPLSVQEHRVTAHSRKPAAYREAIEAMFPTGKRAELFAREAAKGWQAFGDEVGTGKT